MTEMLRKALLAYFRETQADVDSNWELDPTMRRKLQAVVQALEVENMHKVRVVKPRKLKGGAQ